MLKKRENKVGQVSIFVIIAIVIVASVVGYYVVKKNIGIGRVQKEFVEVEEYYKGCIENYARQGIELLEAQGGYIEQEKFEPGSIQYPFSSQLDFNGIGVQYWYYVSGNGITREKVPTREIMEEQLGKFIEEARCDFSAMREKGYGVIEGEKKARVEIKDNSVNIIVNSGLAVSFAEESAVISEHIINIQSKLGKLYNEARKVYDKQKREMILEKYALDVLYLYAPVDDVLIDCAPKVWFMQNISDELRNALEANINSVKQGKEKDYFSKDFGISENVRFTYFKSFPYRIEVWPSDNNVLIAEPIGTQAGLSAMGFCYIPYHFVYDIYFPVLIQVYDEKEIFQFPVAVIIDKNNPREALKSDMEESAEPEICSKKNTEIKVFTYDTDMNPVESRISLKCLDETCPLGETERVGDEAFLQTLAPQCGNAIVYAEAPDYVSEKEIVSTNEFREVNILLNKKYENEAILMIDNKGTEENAVVSFISEKDSASLVWPQQKKIKLSEGEYDISVYAYRNSSLKLPESKKKTCVNQPRKGILGVFGSTEEKCFDMVIPGQTISSVISGGGKIKQYITESELKKGKMLIKIESIPIPNSIEELGKSYQLLEDKKAYVEFTE